MPKGTRHRATGLLKRNGRHHILEMERGNYWFLDMPYRTTHLLGRKVTVEGIRSGFNLLDVTQVIAVDGAPVQPSLWARLRRLLSR